MLNDIEKAVVTAIVKGKPAVKAIKENIVGLTDAAAYNRASQIQNRPNVRAALDEALARNGLTLDVTIAPIKDALTATKALPDGDSAPDHAIRLKASELSLKAHGAFDQDVSVTINQQNIDYSGIDAQEAAFLVTHGRYPSKAELASMTTTYSGLPDLDVTSPKRNSRKSNDDT